MPSKGMFKSTPKKLTNFFNSIFVSKKSKNHSAPSTVDQERNLKPRQATCCVPWKTWSPSNENEEEVKFQVSENKFGSSRTLRSLMEEESALEVESSKHLLIVPVVGTGTSVPEASINYFVEGVKYSFPRDTAFQTFNTWKQMKRLGVIQKQVEEEKCPEEDEMIKSVYIQRSSRLSLDIFDKNEDDDDDVASYSSSDLFELDHLSGIKKDGYCQGDDDGEDDASSYSSSDFFELDPVSGKVLYSQEDGKEEIDDDASSYSSSELFELDFLAVKRKDGYCRRDKEEDAASY